MLHIDSDEQVDWKQNEVKTERRQVLWKSDHFKLQITNFYWACMFLNPYSAICSCEDREHVPTLQHGPHFVG